jgi:ATPase family AAA domain-containing protein 3A/B
LDFNFFIYRQIKLENFDFGKKCEEIAAKTDGFSGRELSKLIVSFQAGAYASEDGKLTEEMINKKLEFSLIAHQNKMKWRSENEKN